MKKYLYWLTVLAVLAWLIWVAWHELPDPIEIVELWGY
jgi:hypothetical protein